MKWTAESNHGSETIIRDETGMGFCRIWHWGNIEHETLVQQIVSLPQTLKKLAELEARIAEIAQKVAPDYPSIESCDSWQHLWAIETSYQGCEAANNDWKRLTEKLQAKIGLTNEQVAEIWIEMKKSDHRQQQ